MYFLLSWSSHVIVYKAYNNNLIYRLENEKTLY